MLRCLVAPPVKASEVLALVMLHHPLQLLDRVVVGRRRVVGAIARDRDVGERFLDAVTIRGGELRGESSEFL